MPPLAPLRKDDGPFCRVCGCTEHNACLATDSSEPFGCSWVETSGNDMPRELCSACAGTIADAMETVERGREILLKSHGEKAALRVVAMARALKVRYDARLRWNAGQTISPTETAAIGVRNMSNH